MTAVVRSPTPIGVRGPSSIPLGKHHNTNPSQHINQLQFNLHAPYSIHSLASNFQKPQPLTIEKFPVYPPSEATAYPKVHHGAQMSSSPTSSVSSERFHFAVQLAKLDAKKLWKEQKELKEMENEKDEIKQNDLRKVKTSQVKATRKSNDGAKRHNVGYVQHKRKRDDVLRKNKQEGIQIFQSSEEVVDSEDKQTREIKRLEKQIQNYLHKLDDLIHKGQEVIQKKDKRLHRRRNNKDDISHLSDEDTDPRQYERAEEQATRSARVLYMIERQIRELDDEIRLKGRHTRQPKKRQTLDRLAAAQRATVRALRMLINSAPLQPKRSQHYPSIYQALTSLIQQLSLLSAQMKEGDERKMVQEYSERRTNEAKASRMGLSNAEIKSNEKHAFSQEPTKNEFNGAINKRRTYPTYRPSIKEIFPDESALTIDPSPERSAALKAGLEALLRAKEIEKKTSKSTLIPANTKKKSVLLPPTLQTKRRKAHAGVQKSVKFPSETAAHFTNETTASRLKKVEKQKKMAKKEVKSLKQTDDDFDCDKMEVWNESEAGSKPVIHHKLHEHEIERQLWLENESRKKLREVMDIPKNLVSKAEEEIKIKLKPILDQAQAVVDRSKSKPVQHRFANIASKVTMKESEALSEMILDDLLVDTAQEFQRLEKNDEVDDEISCLQNSSTLENILQRLEHFEKEEESIRRRLNHVSYSDLYKTKQRQCERESVFTKEEDVVKTSSAVKSSTELKPGDKPAASSFLPFNTLANIFSYREKYSEYLKKTNAEHHGTFNPWQFVERLSDDILDEIIGEVAEEFTGACDDVTEMIFKSEFMKE